MKRQDFERSFAAARFFPPADVSAARVPIFTKTLNTLVTPQGLRKVVGQYNKARDGKFDVVTLGDCTGTFTQVFGLPCKHEIACQLNRDKDWKVSLEDVDPHWHFKRGDGPPPIALPPVPEEAAIHEPEVVKPRGRPKKDPKKTDTSTRRDPSSFELVDLPAGRRRGRPPGSKNKAKATSTQQLNTQNLAGVNHEALQQVIQQAIASFVAQAPAAAPPAVSS